eukprot:9480701-Pyramimonas_sp.AAC.1
MSLILRSSARGHRRCNFRNSRATVLGSRLRRFCKLICTTNLTSLEALDGQQGRPQVAVEMGHLLSPTSGYYLW